MTKKRDTKSPASVLQRLRNACVEGQSVQNAQAIFVLERFLARVARSPYQDRLVLKGGILLHLMLGQWVRPTEDLDFLAMRLPGDSMDQVLAVILSIDGEDGLTFDARGMTWEDIREESGYPCRRFTIPYHFGPKHTRLQVTARDRENADLLRMSASTLRLTCSDLLLISPCDRVSLAVLDQWV